MKRLIIISLTLFSVSAFAQEREPLSRQVVGTPNKAELREQENYPVTGKPNTETRTVTEANSQAYFAAHPVPETVVMPEPDRSSMPSIRPYVNKYNETFTRTATESIYPSTVVYENYRPAGAVAEQPAPKTGTVEQAHTKQTVSDMELNKQNPQRNANSFQPATAQNPGISDAERQKQLPIATPQPVNTTKQKSKGDIIK